MARWCGWTLCFTFTAWAWPGTMAEDDCVELGTEMRMLQLGTAVAETEHLSESLHGKDAQRLTAGRHLRNCGHLLGDECDPSANFFCSNNCPVHSHGEDCYRPVPQVMAEHPGEDGYCYFNFTGFWVSPLKDEDPDFVDYAIQGINGLRGPDYHGHNQGRLLKYHFEGQVVTTYMDSSHYSFDDLYGYSLGYLQNQGLEPSMMKNSSHWIELSKQKCLEIQEKYHFQDEELVLADWLDDNQALATKVFCAANLSMELTLPSIKARANYKSMQDCEPITARDFAKHHYIKCLLGYPNSASDGAYLNVRACLLEGNHIGHFSDCPYSPDMSF
ncbi:Uncharacterized protein SCF082_LOCUS17643 [Durusdinium trenchii]|uniref:Uncharacterized protein n=1 Tax=Durusdinium trenchii TaxID=1381693 RepID=A0ABP0KL93_9DINO